MAGFLRVLVICGLFLALFVVLTNISTANAYSGADYIIYTVQPGDTLWSIADKCGTRINKGELVHEIRELNGKDGKLLSPNIYPGQRIKLLSPP